MKNVDRWFILIGLLYGTFGFAFGIWVGINERFEQAHLHAHINLIGFASMVMFGLLYRAFPAMAESRLAALHFILFNIGAVIFLVGIPLAQAIRPWLSRREDRSQCSPACSPSSPIISSMRSPPQRGYDRRQVSGPPECPGGSRAGRAPQAWSPRAPRLLA